jgi:hypothetical protein
MNTKNQETWNRRIVGEEQNVNGLTFTEWLTAANKDAEQYGPIRLIWYSAWLTGEDPCEWHPSRERNSA